MTTSLNKSEVLSIIADTAIVAMLRLPSADDALDMGAALIACGIPCLQIPLTVPGATEVIAELRRTQPGGVLIGAGTVLDARSAEACFDAGAQFVVSPIANPATIDRCTEAGVAMIAGALTPSEVVAAWQAGADMVRVYPAGVLGGPSYLKLLRASLPQIRLLAAGGVDLQTASAFLHAGAAALEIDQDLVDLDALRGGRVEEIRTNANLYIDVVVQALALVNGTHESV